MSESSDFVEGFCSDQGLVASPQFLAEQVRWQPDFLSILNAFSFLVWQADSTGTVVHLSDQWEAMTGLAKGEGCGQGLFDWVHPADRDRVWAKWQHAVKTQQPLDVRARFKHQTGDYRPVWLTARPFASVSSAGGLDGWMGAVVDLAIAADLPLAERSLAECSAAAELVAEVPAIGDLASAPDFQAVITRHMAEGLCLMRLSDGMILDVNPKFEQMFGYGPGELHGQNVALLNYPKADEHPVAVTQRLLRIVREQGESTYEVHNVKKDGTPFWCRVAGSVVEHPEYGPTLVAVQQDITDQKQVEQDLRYSEQRFQAIFNQSVQFMGVLDPTGLLLEVNQAALDLGGVTLAEVAGKPFWDTYWWTIAPDTQAQLKDAIAQAAQGQFLRYEVAVLGRGQAVITLDFSLKPVQDEKGQVVLLISEGRDITQRKEAEAKIRSLNTELEDRVAQRTAQLEASNQRYETLTRVSPVGIFRANRDGTAIYVNDRWGLMAGLSTEEVQGNRWLKAIHPRDRRRVLSLWQQAVQSDSLFQAEYRFRHRNGTDLWVYGQAIPEIDSTGEIVGYVGTITDITELKRAEQALKDSEELFRGTFEQAAVGFAQLTLDGRWLRVNQKMCDIVGYTRAELLELTFDAITHPDDLPQDLACIQRLLTGESANCVLEKRYLHKDSSPIWVNVTVSLIYDSLTGKPKYFVGVIEDISKRRQIEADRRLAEQALQDRAIELIQLNALLAKTASKLEERNRELDQFAYIASHDLKAPLRAIANLSEWLEDDLQGQLPPENQQQLQLLRSRVYRMDALINGLLQYSRVGRTDQAIAPTDIRELVLEVVDSLDPPAAITIHMPPHLPTLPTRKLLLQQVFANLISNAIKHRDRPQGNIHITAQDHGLSYEFAVTDDGPGIAPENHDRIFLIFQTLASRDQTENTGVGLSIVKKIIETEGGAIRVESQLGQGTTFRFTWPKQPARSPET